MRAYLAATTVVLLVLVSVFSVLSDVFMSWPNMLNIALASSTIGILAIGAAFVIGAAGLDLSVGSLMALCSVVAILCVQQYSMHWSIVPLIALASGITVGAFNGWLIGYIGIPALIVTLGMLSIARGLAYIFSNGRPVYGLPEPLLFVGQGDIIGVPMPVIVFLVLGMSVHVLLRHTAFGQYALAIGDSETAVRNAGIRVMRHRLMMYTMSGAIAAIAGIVYVARVNAVDPNAGTMYELRAITAAIIGGTALFGGRASIAGAIIGALIMGVLGNGLGLLNVSSYYQHVAIGSVLILAVAAGQWKVRHYDYT